MTAQPISTSRVAPPIPQSPSTTAPTTKGFSDLSSEDFFGLLIAQLQSQDPLKPTDNQTLMTQMSTIKQMQTSSQLNQTLTSLAASQRFGGASSLIGQYVSGTVTDSAGNPTTVQGVVLGVHFDPTGSPILELHNGINLPADKVTDVTVVQNLPPDVQQQVNAQTAAAASARNKTGLLASHSATPPVNTSLVPTATVSATAGKQSNAVNVLNAVFGASNGFAL